ncbi:FRG domain-containing protein [Chishuiella sp.]|uniref:FRG domain-containing protein n=1 Tax=Chishuiella sp. TaxID=1969467 RepID=UPI0028A6F884|nr:FRG domain-containing protein [Chishuiella sp.]
MELDTNITSLSEYIKFINNIEHRHISQWFYRGHSDSDYELIPSLFRVDTNESWAHWDRIEDYVMSQFKREAFPYLKTIPNDEIEWLTIAQHYGLPTRLLDWSTNPLIALYFAVENYQNNKDANVWLYGLSSTNNCWTESTWIAKKINLSGNIYENIIFPLHIDSRITNQSGCFTIHEIPEHNTLFIPVDQNPRIFDTFIKLTINKDIKKDILNELYYVGIHRGFIYPGLEGISSKIKFEIGTTHKRTSYEDLLKVQKK